jgi:exodeoxyribonuclease I
MRMVQVVSACLPNAITIPISSEGKRTFNLGLVSQANAIALDNAHEALADTAATLELAKLVKQRAIWSTLMANARKSTPQGLITNNAALLLSETARGIAYNLIVTPITPNASNANEWALFDLQFDPAELLDGSDEKLREAIDGEIKVIRRVFINAQPGLLPLDLAPEDICGGRLSQEAYQARANVIREHVDFRRRVSRLLADRSAGKAPPIY